MFFADMYMTIDNIFVREIRDNIDNKLNVS